MRSPIVHAIKSLVMWACASAHRRFQRELASPRATQKKLLTELLLKQSQTEYGQSLNITGRESEDEFRRLVPIRDYNDPVLVAWVERQRAQPKLSILVPGGIKHFEKTSGSSGTRKLIPYNRGLLGSFDRYFRLWLYDLLRNGPRLETMRVFISISPTVQTPNDLAGNVGLADDSEYISPLLRWVLKRFLTVPLSLKLTKDPVQFLDLLVTHLAADEKLEVLSIWHPSFFLVAWNHLLVSREKIATLVKSRNERAAMLLSSENELRPNDLWPNLKLISAWDAANSHLPASQLKTLFPNVFFQGKGLLATEAPMTVPLIGQGSLPFLGEVLFEFVDENGDFFWIDELQSGVEYSLVVSQKGGLLRYRVGDRVRVDFGASHATPFLNFIGRAQDSSDLVGEKLTSGYLASHDDKFLAESGSPFYIFLPQGLKESEKSWHRPNYVALVESHADSEQVVDTRLSNWWEEKLVQSHHYAFARNMGQLGRVEVVRVPRLQRQLLDFYTDVKGMKTGDIKLRTLLSDPMESRQILAELKIKTKESTR